MTILQMLLGSGGGLVIPLPSLAASKALPAPGTYTASLRWATDGVAYDQDGFQAGTYVRPKVTGVTAPYWLKVSLTSGTAPTGSLDTWQQLTADLTYGLTTSSGIKQCSLNWFISSSGSDATLLAGGTATVYAESIII